MPDETPATAPDTPASGVDNATLIAAFLAEGGADNAAAAPTAPAAEPDKTEPEAATEAAEEGETAETTEEEPEAEAEEPIYDTVALAAAIEAEDPKAFIEALGPAAEKLLGAKAHKALRLQATELKKERAKIDALATKWADTYGDPIRARKAAAEGDINAFLDNIERQYGAPWTAMVKAVNEAMAGKPARIENVAETAKRAELAHTATREAARAKVRADITRHVETADKSLVKACPRVVDLVYETMRTGWSQGVNTPAKALTLVKKQLKSEAAALVKLFAPPKPKPKTAVTPPRAERQTPARPQTDAEMREEFLRSEGLWRGP